MSMCMRVGMVAMGARGSDTRCELRTSAACGVLCLVRVGLMTRVMMMMTVMTMVMMSVMLTTVMVMVRTVSRMRRPVVAGASVMHVATWWAHLRAVRARAMARWAVGLRGVTVLRMPPRWRRNWTCMMQMMMHGVVDMRAGMRMLMMVARVCV